MSRTDLISFSDNSPAVQGQVSGSGGNFSVTIPTHYLKQTGTVTLTTTIFDRGGSRATVDSTITVAANSLTVTVSPDSVVEGASSPITVATIADSDGHTQDQFSATVTWPDGSSSPGTVNGTSVSATPPSTLAEGNTGVVTVAVTDSDGTSATGSGTLTVSDAPISGSGQAVTATAGTPFVGTVATLVDQDPHGEPGDYNASIDWGDGTTTGGCIEAQGASS